MNMKYIKLNNINKIKKILRNVNKLKIIHTITN